MYDAYGLAVHSREALNSVARPYAIFELPAKKSSIVKACEMVADALSSRSERDINRVQNDTFKRGAGYLMAGDIGVSPNFKNPP